MAYVAIGLAAFSYLTAEEQESGGGGGGAFMQPRKTHSEMLKDIAQAAPIGETGQEGTIQGSTESAAQLESRKRYERQLTASLIRAGESASSETQRQVLAQALQMMPLQPSDSSPTTVQNRPVRV